MRDAMSTASIRQSEWSHQKVRYRGSTSGTVEYIYRRAPGEDEWEPWLVAAPSAVLHRAGAEGHGLYVARRMAKDTVVGLYEGRVVAHYDTREQAMHSKEAAKLVRSGVDKLVALRSRNGPGYDVVDGSETASTPPCVPLVNDRRNTRPKLGINCVITEHGYLRVTRSHMPAFNLNAPLQDNVDSELRTAYGDAFWELMESLLPCE